MIWTMANSIAIPPTTPPMIAPVRIPVLFVELELEVGDEVLVVDVGDDVLVVDVVDILDKGKRCLKGAKNRTLSLLPPAIPRRIREEQDLILSCR